LTSYPIYELLHYLRVRRIDPARFGYRRGDTGLLLDVLESSAI
jgi:hypothetical protein